MEQQPMVQGEQPYLDLLDRIPQWQPIETAPKNGKPLLLWETDFNEAAIGSWSESLGYWVRDGFTDDDRANIMHDVCGVTHWQPLPKPPEL